MWGHQYSSFLNSHQQKLSCSIPKTWHYLLFPAPKVASRSTAKQDVYLRRESNPGINLCRSDCSTNRRRRIEGTIMATITLSTRGNSLTQTIIGWWALHNFLAEKKIRDVDQSIFQAMPVWRNILPFIMISSQLVNTMMPTEHLNLL